MEETLSNLSNEERIAAVDTIYNGCNHLFSKGKLQDAKFEELAPVFMNLAKNDPVFLAHFTSYIIKYSDNKDLKLLATFASSLSDADGTPFEAGSEYKKPDLRKIAQAAVQDRSFDVKQIWRLIEIANKKSTLGGYYSDGTHFSKKLKTAIRKYILFREKNPKAIEGVRKTGFGKRFRDLYKTMRMKPSDDAKAILGWRYSKGYDKADGENVQKKEVFDFKGMKPIEIAEKIRNEKLPPMGVLGALPDKISPVVAVAILEQCSGDQAVILREIFDSQGLLKNKEVLKLFEQKILEARTALDRVERINTEIDEAINKVMESARSTVRKKQATDLGKVYVHLDISSSMNAAIQVAKDYGATIAECVPEPEKNFAWAAFNSGSVKLQKPKTFEKAAFNASLYGVRAGGMTDMLANWGEARNLKSDVDIFITDCGHNGRAFVRELNSYEHKPKVVGIVLCFPRNTGYGVQREDAATNNNYQQVKAWFENNGIPVALIKEEALKESALVAQTLKEALKGREALIEEIMNTPLLKLPQWWETV